MLTIFLPSFPILNKYSITLQRVEQVVIGACQNTNSFILVYSFMSLRPADVVSTDLHFQWQIKEVAAPLILPAPASLEHSQWEKHHIYSKFLFCQLKFMPLILSLDRCFVEKWHRLQSWQQGIGVPRTANALSSNFSDGLWIQRIVQHISNEEKSLKWKITMTKI